MTIKNRLDKLEQHAPALPWISFMQDLSNPDLWHGRAGDDRTTAELEALAATHNVMRICWHDGAPGDGKGQQIDLTWGDED